MDKADSFAVLVSCEHGGNRIPKRYKPLFGGAEETLATHRGLDIGAAALSRRIARVLDAPLFLHEYSRLLADANRHPRSPTLFSEFTRELDPGEKNRILEKYHAPHRRAVETWVRQAVIDGKAVLHLSIHSFTPVLKGKIRTADIGFLYDPKREEEKRVCRSLRDAFRITGQGLRCRRNYPYRGVSDSLTTSLRKQFPAPWYAGIEIEVNQRFALAKPEDWRSFQACFLRTCTGALISLKLIRK